MGLRVCLVTPFAWSQPHDVNEHVAGVAAELRALGHAVTVLAPSNRARDLAAGRRVLLDGAETAAAAAERFPGRYHVVSPGVDLELFRPAPKQQQVVLEWRPNERPLLRSLVLELAELEDWQLVALRTKPLTGKPPVSRALRG